MRSSKYFLLFLTLICLMPILNAHGVMSHPPQRGCLQGRAIFCPKMYSENAPTDWLMHLPAGNKSPLPGSGARSQIKEAGVEGWTPFEPLIPSYRWRAGVCGDLRDGEQKHMRGGQYYHGGMISESYKQGSVIDIDLSIVGYHNGFVEFHVCDVAKCGGEISESCFHTAGACHLLQREWTEECQNGTNGRCGPIDQEYPERWYLPCPIHLADYKPESFGANAIRYRLPSDLHCEHCVLHWYWATGNKCNAPGLENYYLGPDKPVGWGDCEGQSGAKGGYAHFFSECGGDHFAEEYLQCADIRIHSNGDHEGIYPQSFSGDGPPTTEVSAATSPSVTSATNSVATTGQNDVWMSNDEYKTCAQYSRMNGPKGTFGIIHDIVLIGNGCRILSLHRYPVVDIAEFSWVAIEAVTAEGAQQVHFFVNGEKVSTSSRAPFFLNHGRWENPIVNKPFEIIVSGHHDTDFISVTLRK